MLLDVGGHVHARSIVGVASRRSEVVPGRLVLLRRKRTDSDERYGLYRHAMARGPAMSRVDRFAILVVLALLACPSCTPPVSTLMNGHGSQGSPPDDGSTSHAPLVLMTDNSDDCLALLEAAKDQDLDTAKRLLATGIDPNCSDPSGRTALHVAVGRNAVLLVSLLVEGGADVDSQNQLGETPIRAAVFVESDVTAAVRTLLAAGADPSIATNSGDTALHQAAFRENEPLVLVLLDGGASPDAPDAKGETPLHWVVMESGKVPTIELLLRNDASPNLRGDNGMTPLYYPAFYGRVDQVRSLLAYGADPNVPEEAFDWTPLVAAVQGDHAETVALLLDHGGDPNFLVRRTSAIHHASVRGEPAIVHLLLEHGADPNLRNNFQRTPLHLAAWNGSQAAVPLLLERGGDPCAKTPGGETAIDLAETQGHSAIARRLRAARPEGCSG